MRIFSFTGLFSLVLFISTNAQITSTFDIDADGWTFSRAGVPQTINYNSTNGNPAGYVSVTYASNTTIASEGWFAPAKFLGSQVARSYGMNLRFDMQQAFAGTNSSGQGDVRIQTLGGFVIVFSLPVKPAVAPAWSSYSIKLDETVGWRIGSTGGALATENDVISALSDIKFLEIRGTYITDPSNVSGLDNVVLEQKTLTTAPTITSLSSLSGIPGASLTINGNNFGVTAVQNSVYFGTTKATITGGNAMQLNVTIPAGAQYAPVTVINLTTGLLAQSLQNFSPLFNNNNDIGGRIIPSSMDLKDNITLGASKAIRGLALGDLDGDGLVDIVVSEPDPAISELSVFRNLGVTGDINASSFAPRITLGRGYFENVVIDLDGDGKLDIVVLDSFGFNSFFLVYRNISTPGTIAFEASESFINPSSGGSMHVADIDGDGRPDLLATHPSTGASYYFWIAQNLSTPGDTQFGAGVVWDNGLFVGSSDISSGDLNGDGKVEVIVAHGGTFSIFPNQSTSGTIALGSAFMIDPTNNVTKVEIADLDNDSKPDLIWASSDAATAIRIRKNIYSGGAFSASSFDPEIVIAAPGFAVDDLTLADMNADNKLDIVATNARDLGIFQSVFSGTLSSTSFMPPVLFQGNTFIESPLQPVVADLDGDNKPDVVTANLGNPNPAQIWIYRNTCFPAPTITNVSPAIGQGGTSLIVSGNFMNTNLATPKVKFGSVPAAAGSISNTSLTSVIPVGAQSDRVSVSLHGLTAFSKPLTVTFPTSRTINASSFSTPAEFALTTATDGLTIADFDDDGKKDVVVNDNNIVKIFRNTLFSTGTAITATTLTGITTTIAQAVRVTATDIDGDSKIDLIANSAIHRNNSGSTVDAISFEPFIQSIISGANGFAVDDFNHDGKSDFAYTTNGNTYEVDENVSRKGAFTFTGGGPFGTIINSSIAAGAGGQVTGITAGDFDGDGYSDFAFGVNAGTDVLSVVRNTGLNEPLAPAQFAAAVTFPALDIPSSIASADFDGDGKLDIVLGNNNSAFISIYRNSSTVGSISFLAKQDIAALTRAIDIEAVDLDGDSKPEIVVAHQPTSTTGSFTVFQNTSSVGSISFSTGINYPLTRGPFALAIADINLDAKPDLIFTANGTTDALLVFENKISLPPPTITSFTPTSGPIGTTVTITGTSFSTTTASNIVYFGATRATVTAATTTQLTVTVPTGATHQPISVQTNGLTAHSHKPFVVTFAGGGSFDNCSFEPKVNFETNDGLSSEAFFGDIDGDGKVDVITTKRDINSISIYRNTSISGQINSSSFAPKIDIITGTSGSANPGPVAISFGDIDGDGKPDIAVTNYRGGTLAVFRNLSTPGIISLSTRVEFAIGDFATGLSLRDIDGDGKLDAVVTSFSDGVSVLRNTATSGIINASSFASRLNFATGPNPFHPSIADFDSDGKLDIAVPNANNYTYSLLHNTSTSGTVSFAPQQVVTYAAGTPVIGTGTYPLSAGDLDGDGKIDLVVSNNTLSIAPIFRNTSIPGTITFAPQVDLTTSAPPAFSSISDLDGDGKIDLAIYNGLNNPILIYKNSNVPGTISTSLFGSPIGFGADPLVGIFGSADIDGDGKNDIVNQSIGLYVLRNVIGEISPPAITSFTPSSGPVGTTVTITGTNFSTPFTNTVQFNGVPATITASTAASLTVTVPVGATTGPIQITIGCNTATSSNFTVGFLPIAITTQPSDFITCIGGIAMFTTSATGTTNITYQWQFSTTLTGTYNDIANGGGYSNVATASLSVNTTGNFGAGFYRAKVNGDLAATDFSSAAQLIVNTNPPAPTVTGASNCGTGSVTLSATGAVAGQYRWYTVATGGTVLTGEVNNTYTTPVLSATTTYFVSIINGTCESSRTLVTATINSTPAKPTITSSIAPSANIVSVCSSNVLTLSAPAGFSTYTWSPGGNTQQITASASGSYSVIVTDAAGCSSVASDVLTVMVIPAPCSNQAPVITTASTTTQIEGKVSLDLVSLISDPDNNIDIQSLKIKIQPTSGAKASITASGLLELDYQGISFSGPDVLTIEVCDLLGDCTQQEIKIEVIGDLNIYTGISPNGDGLNDFWIIQYIDVLAETKDNKVSVYNRWGDVVFETENYDNKDRVFKGLNKNGNEVSSGTYFYKIEFGSGRKTETGYLSLKR